MTIVSLRIRTNEPSPAGYGRLYTAIRPIVNNPFPLAVQWEKPFKIEYRYPADGTVRYKREE